MPITPIDEQLVSALKVQCSIQNVYHQEVYQSVPSENRFPCAVYILADHSPEQELTGNADCWHATYDVTLITADDGSSAWLRNTATTVQSLSSESVNDTLWSGSETLLWIDVLNDVEGTEFAIEQQEKGKKTTSLTIVITHTNAG